MIQIASIAFLLSLVDNISASSLLANRATRQPHYNRVSCYSDPGPLQFQGSSPLTSPEYCQQQCWNKRATVAALTAGNQCFCGNELPNSSSQVEDGSCNVKCAGQEAEYCMIPFKLHIPFRFLPHTNLTF